MLWHVAKDEAPAREILRRPSPAAPEAAPQEERFKLLQRVINDPAHEQMLAKGSIAVVSRRHPDKVTAHNEDSAAVLAASSQTAAIVIADGVGGSRGGDVASGTLVECLSEVVSGEQGRYPSLRTGILDALETANDKILASGIGAATTAAIVEINGERIRPYHIGDSMILVVGQKGKIKYQSVSHSPVGFAIESGLLNEEEAMYHESRHIVSNVVGSTDMRIEIGPQLTLAKRDTVLLASDGLFDNLHIDEIVEIVRKGPLKTAVDRLLEVAVERMTSPEDGIPSKADDATIAAFRLRPAKRKAARKKPASRPDSPSEPTTNPESVTADDIRNAVVLSTPDSAHPSENIEREVQNGATTTLPESASIESSRDTPPARRRLSLKEMPSLFRGWTRLVGDDRDSEDSSQT